MAEKRALREFAARLQSFDWVEQAYITWRKDPPAHTSDAQDTFVFQDLTVQVRDAPGERKQDIEHCLTDESFEMLVETADVTYCGSDGMSEEVLRLTRAPPTEIDLPTESR